MILSEQVLPLPLSLLVFSSIDIGDYANVMLIPSLCQSVLVADGTLMLVEAIPV
ncbi:hypothetical protein SASPL_137648 [Salvia splendens]|uniref:Uncharacterized protein n=1 Tax=Salvia splendens TaxID=180675 RepID=A0A8X8WUS6_SALSN|nr:hypothetical protein SASPL_137648 [Salvia splendens]